MTSEKPVRYKPTGFVGFVGWASLIVGLYIVSASLFGVIYLVVAGKAALGLVAYFRPILIGGLLTAASGGLLLGHAWSRFLYLGICVLSLFSLYGSLPRLLLLGLVGGSTTKMSLLSMFWMLVSSLQWPIAGFVSTYFVFRHFRAAKEIAGRTPDPVASA